MGQPENYDSIRITPLEKDRERLENPTPILSDELKKYLGKYSGGRPQAQGSAGPVVLHDTGATAEFVGYKLDRNFPVMADVVQRSISKSKEISLSSLEVAVVGCVRKRLDEWRAYESGESKSHPKPADGYLDQVADTLYRERQAIAPYVKTIDFDPTDVPDTAIMSMLRTSGLVRDDPLPINPQGLKSLLREKLPELSPDESHGHGNRIYNFEKPDYLKSINSINPDPLKDFGLRGSNDPIAELRDRQSDERFRKSLDEKPIISNLVDPRDERPMTPKWHEPRDLLPEDIHSQIARMQRQQEAEDERLAMDYAAALAKFGLTAKINVNPLLFIEPPTNPNKKDYSFKTIRNPETGLRDEFGLK